MLDSSELIATTMVSLLETARWTKIALFYDISREYYSSIAQAFNRQVGQRVQRLVVGISASNLLPIHQIRGNFRVVFLLVDTDLLNRVMCTAYHSGYSFPAYQYILTLDSVNVAEVSNQCNESLIEGMLVGTISIGHQLVKE